MVNFFSYQLLSTVNSWWNRNSTYKAEIWHIQGVTFFLSVRWPNFFTPPLYAEICVIFAHFVPKKCVIFDKYRPKKCAIFKVFCAQNLHLNILGLIKCRLVLHIVVSKSRFITLISFVFLKQDYPLKLVWHQIKLMNRTDEQGWWKSYLLSL